MLNKDQIAKKVSKAVRQYWGVRGKQAIAQGSSTGTKDYGRRGEVTGGKQLDGFVSLAKDLLVSCGLKGTQVFAGRAASEIPGYYRPTKNWDVIAVASSGKSNSGLIACIEIKSLGGPSFGNNFNNRVEEALGNSADVWKAYEREVLPLYPKPFLGYIMLLEEAPASTSAVRISSPHFKVDEIFSSSSYKERMKILCERMIRERAYDAASLILASRMTGVKGKYSEPVGTLTLERFANALCAHIASFLSQLGKNPLI